MDPQMLRTLEYDRIIDQLIQQATSETGKKAAAGLQPSPRGMKCSGCCSRQPKRSICSG